MSLEDELPGELPGGPEGERTPDVRWRGERPEWDAADELGPPDRAAPRDATSRADKRRNQRR